VGHPPPTTSAVEEVEVEAGGDDGDGDGADTSAAVEEVAAEVGQSAAAVVAAEVDHPEKLALQRPSC
jgi:hypothetical protein